MANLWRYRAGRPGHNLVIVYERRLGGPLWLEWWPRGERERKPLSKLEGRRIYDPKLAMRIADRLAARIEAGTKGGQVNVILGIPERHTVAELLAAYHDKRGKRWSASNQAHQKAMRDFWARRLGKDTNVLHVNAAAVESIASEETERRGWGPRTEGRHLKYVKTAWRFGRLKLKWFGEAHDLSAVDVPSPDSASLSYTTGEVRALLRVLPDVDLRAGVAAYIAYLSLRRIAAIRHLATVNLTKRGAVYVVDFARQHDKRRKRGEVVLAGSAVTLMQMLMQRPAVQASGLLFPDGSLDDGAGARKPVRYELLNDWLAEAERRAKVEYVKGRSWHAFKRRATTDAEELMGGLGAAAKQAGTLEATLRAVYMQHDLAPKIELAEKLARHVGEG